MLIASGIDVVDLDLALRDRAIPRATAYDSGDDLHANDVKMLLKANELIPCASRFRRKR